MNAKKIGIAIATLTALAFPLANVFAVANWIEIPLTFVDDLKATVGEVASDLWVLIALVIGLPLAFWVIRRAIGLVRARG